MIKLFSQIWVTRANTLLHLIYAKLLLKFTGGGENPRCYLKEDQATLESNISQMFILNKKLVEIFWGTMQHFTLCLRKIPTFEMIIT